MVGPDDQLVARWERKLHYGHSVAKDVDPWTLAQRFAELDMDALAAEATLIACRERATKPALEHFEAAAERLEDGAEPSEVSAA